MKTKNNLPCKENLAYVRWTKENHIDTLVSRLPLEGSAAEQEGARTSKPESRQGEHIPLRIRKSEQ